MKLNGALKPRQGASIQGSSPGVVLKKYRDKRYYKLNENVVNGLSFYYICGPSYTEQKQIIVKNRKTKYKRIIYNTQKQKQTLSQQTPIQKEQESNDCYSSFKNSISRLNREIKYLKIQNKETEYKITTITQATAIGNKSFRFIDLNRISEEEEVENTDIKAVILSAEEEKQKNTNTKYKNNITTRQVTKTNKKDKNYYNNNNKNKNKKNKNIKKSKQTIEVQVTKETKKTTFLEHHVNVNQANNINKYNKSEFIYTIQQQQQQQQLMVNKFLSIVKIYESLILCELIILAAIISRFLVKLKLLLFFMYSHAIKHLNDDGYSIDRSRRNVIMGDNHNRGSICSSTISYCTSFVVIYAIWLKKVMRVSNAFVPTTLKNVNKSRLNSSMALWLMVCAAVTILLPQPVVSDDGDNFFPINGIETTTPEFDYASRGQKKFGDKCENTLECGFPGSICDPKKKSCQCTEDLPVTNHIDKCGKEAAVNESCFFNEQCEVKYFQTECRDQRCVCRFDMTPVWLKDGTVECKGRGDKKGPETYIDPAMIGVLIGMALMFIIICVVLRLFSQARWRENRTIFNTPNPRLMNVSLLRESKLLHGQERRGSRMSVRVPSRQPSMASLRPHSPNPSLGKTGRMTRSKSNTRSSDSRVSDASNCSRLLEHHNTANVHHASHTHANTITNSQTTHVPYTSASVSPLSINAPSTTLTHANQTPMADISSTACSTNLTTPPPTNTNKSNKF